MHFFKKNFLYIIAVLISLSLYACSSSKSTEVENNQQGVTHQPESKPWYENQKDFSSDSLSYFSVASSISTDSLRAVIKARKLAKAQLNTGMQSELEKLRVELVKEGGKNASAGKPGFIWLMRGATLHQLNHVEVVKNTVNAKNGIYQAYVKVKYSKIALRNDLLQALAGNRSYLDALKNSHTFNQWFAYTPQKQATGKTAN